MPLMNEYIHEVEPLNTWTRYMFNKSQYNSHQIELSTEFFCGTVEKSSHYSA